MEDKTFELLTKMYGEFSSRFDGVENRLKKVEFLIENDVKKDINSLYDGYKQTYEEVVVVRKTMNEISSKVDRLSDKVDRQEVEIKVIKGGKV